MDTLTTSAPGDRLLSDTARQVSRHSMLVRQLRLIVPALAVGLMITYALSATPPQIDRAFAEQFASIEADEEGVKLTTPRYSGEDLQGQPFEMEAATATRPHENPDLVELVNPEARRVRSDGQESVVRSLDGQYDEVARVLDLRDEVKLEHRTAGGDFVFLTDQAQLDVDSQVVTTASEVRGSGDSGTVDAGRATFYQNEDRMVLEGGVKIRLEPTAPAQGSGDDAKESDSR